MGSIILPVCENCGYKTAKIYFGGGMNNHLTHCGVPALNTETNEIVTVNYKDEHIIENSLKDNPTYKIYNQPNMFLVDEKVGSHRYSIFHAGVNGGKHYYDELYFKISGNLCPKCQTYNLQFESCGCWD